MNDTIYDIKMNIKQFKDCENYPIIDNIISDLSDYNYDQGYINMFGDSYKTTSCYTIGDYEFKYYHICGDEMIGAKFKMKHKDKEKYNKLYTWDIMTAMRSKIKGVERSKVTDDVFNRTEDFEDFCKIYKCEVIIFFILCILNSFITGHCISVLFDPETEKYVTEYVQLNSFINVEHYSQ